MTQQVQTQPAIMTNVVELQLSQVVVDPKKNSRTVMDPKIIEDLADTIKVQGQLSPVRVERRPDGKFELVFGYRRFAALEMLAKKYKDRKDPWVIRAEVVEKMEAVDRKIANIAENIAREDLTTFDQAAAFSDLRKNEELSGAKIASSVGKSTQYVNHLIRCYEGVADCILERWKKECEPNFGMDPDTGKRLPGIHAVCTMDWLGKLVAHTPKADQEYELKLALGLIKDDEDDTDGDGDGNQREPRQPGAPKRASMKQLSEALAKAEEKKKELGNPEGKNQKEQEAAAREVLRITGVIQGLKLAIGKGKSIAGVYTIKTAEGGDDN